MRASAEEMMTDTSASGSSQTEKNVMRGMVTLNVSAPCPRTTMFHSVPFPLLSLLVGECPGVLPRPGLLDQRQKVWVRAD